MFGGGVAGNLLAGFTNTELQGGVGGGVALGIVGHEGGDNVIPGEGEGGGAELVELGDDADVESGEQNKSLSFNLVYFQT